MKTRGRSLVRSRQFESVVWCRTTPPGRPKVPVTRALVPQGFVVLGPISAAPGDCFWLRPVCLFSLEGKRSVYLLCRQLQLVYAEGDLRAAGVCDEHDAGARLLRLGPGGAGRHQGVHRRDPPLQETHVHRVRNILPFRHCSEFLSGLRSVCALRQNAVQVTPSELCASEQIVELTSVLCPVCILFIRAHIRTYARARKHTHTHTHTRHTHTHEHTY